MIFKEGTMDEKLFQDVAHLAVAALFKEMEESPDTVRFLEQRKWELMASLLNIDYSYMRTPEGRDTLYVAIKIKENYPKLKDLFRRNGLLGEPNNFIG